MNKNTCTWLELDGDFFVSKLLYRIANKILYEMYFSWTIMFIILFKITSICRQIRSNNFETIME